MVSSVHGPLRQLLLCFPERAARSRGYRAAYADLIEKLPAATRLTVLVHPRAAADLQVLLESAGRNGQATVVESPPDLEFTVWAQDPFLAIADGGSGPCLVQSQYFRREGDAKIVETLACATPVRTERSSLCFQGGHVLTGDDFILIGRDCVRPTLEALAKHGGLRPPAGRDPVDYCAAIFRNCLDPSRRIVFVGTDLEIPAEEIRPIPGTDRVELVHASAGSTQPLDHLDMFVSLAGRGPSGPYRLLVGSPGLADRILGRPTLALALDRHFDDIAALLAARGFEVIRNPLPLTYGDGRRRVEGEERDVRIWYFASSNNCLLQIDHDDKQVWLPTYGHRGWKELAVTDAENARIWTGLGFTVHRLANFHPFAQKHGAVHCIAKELER